MAARALLSILLLLPACSYRVEKEEVPQFDPQQIGFAEVQRILGPKCARCHGAMVASYEQVVASLEEIGARIQSQSPGFQMPPPGAAPLSASEKASLLAWIQRGAPFAGEGQSPAPPEPPVTPPALTFASVQERVLVPKCARCHSGMVSSHDSVVANLREIESRVRSPLEFEQMPPPRAPQLSEEEKNLLLDWIQAGAPES